MRRFFDTLYSSLNRGARAVLQIYPENGLQAESLTTAAMRAGFSGGLVVDFPHSTRAKKYFLVLMVGGMAAVPEPKGFSGEVSDEEGGTVSVAGRAHVRKKQRAAGGHGLVTSSLMPENCYTPLMPCTCWSSVPLTKTSSIAVSEVFPSDMSCQAGMRCALQVDESAHAISMHWLCRCRPGIQKQREKHGFSRRRSKPGGKAMLAFL